MNLLDLLILIPIVWGFIRGFTKGLIIELATLAGMVLGIIAAIYFEDNVSGLIRNYFSFSSATLKIISYILIFVAVLLVAYLLGKIIEKLVDMVALGWLNKILGAVVGMAKGAIVAGIIVFIIISLDVNEKVIPRHTKEKSMFYQTVSKIVPSLIPKVESKESRQGVV